MTGIDREIKLGGMCMNFGAGLAPIEVVNEMLANTSILPRSDLTFPYMLTDEALRDVSDGLIDETHLYDPKRSKESLDLLIAKLDHFLNSARSKQAIAVEIVTSVGFSINSDFEFIETSPEEYSKFLYEKLGEQPELPSIWMIVKFQH